MADKAAAGKAALLQYLQNTLARVDGKDLDATELRTKIMPSVVASIKGLSAGAPEAMRQDLRKTLTDEGVIPDFAADAQTFADALREMASAIGQAGQPAPVQSSTTGYGEENAASTTKAATVPVAKALPANIAATGAFVEPQQVKPKPFTHLVAPWKAPGKLWKPNGSGDRVNAAGRSQLPEYCASMLSNFENSAGMGEAELKSDVIPEVAKSLKRFLEGAYSATKSKILEIVKKYKVSDPKASCNAADLVACLKEVISLFEYAPVRILDNNAFLIACLEVDIHATTEEIQQKVGAAILTEPQKVILQLGENKLGDKSTLVEQGITRGQQIDLKLALKVATLSVADSGSLKCIDVGVDDLVQDVQKTVALALGWEPVAAGRLRLLLSDEMLSSDKTLADYGISVGQHVDIATLENKASMKIVDLNGNVVREVIEFGVDSLVMDVVLELQRGLHQTKEHEELQHVKVQLCLADVKLCANQAFAHYEVVHGQHVTVTMLKEKISLAGMYACETWGAFFLFSNGEAGSIPLKFLGKMPIREEPCLQPPAHGFEGFADMEVLWNNMQLPGCRGGYWTIKDDIITVEAFTDASMRDYYHPCCTFKMKVSSSADGLVQGISEVVLDVDGWDWWEPHRSTSNWDDCFAKYAGMVGEFRPQAAGEIPESDKRLPEGTYEAGKNIRKWAEKRRWYFVAPISDGPKTTQDNWCWPARWLMSRKR